MKIELKLTLIAVCALTLVLVGNVDDAEAAAYLKFDGIDGEAKDSAHEGWSDLLSFEQVIHKPGGSQTGATRQRGSVIMEDIVVVKELDKSSPKLAESVLMGKVFPTVKFQLASSTGTYFMYELKNVMITSYSISGDTDQVPMEELALNFNEIKVTYTEMDSKGIKKGNIEYSWKVEEGTK